MITIVEFFDKIMMPFKLNLVAAEIAFGYHVALLQSHRTHVPNSEQTTYF